MTPCRPPDGTPDGTPCWLYYDPPDRPREWIALRWLGQGVWANGRSVWADVYDVPAIRVARAGWRFHSIAEVPHE